MSEPNEAGWFDHDRPLKVVLNAAIRLRAKIHGEAQVTEEIKALAGHFAGLGADIAANSILKEALTETEH